MDAPEESCSSINLVADGPMLPLPFSGRTGVESVHESHASASNGSNTPLATVLKSQTISPGNATAAIKLNPTLPRNVSSSVIQSSWIQRLKPFSQSSTPKEEPANLSTKEKPICTHFSKDFSSCSRRLDKPSHHTRSSSWPPHALRLQGVEQFPLELGEPADVTEGHGKAAVNSLDIDLQSIRVPSSNNITHSSDAGSRTGNLFAQQQSSCKQVFTVEGFLPCVLNRENLTMKKLNDVQESERGGDSKPKDCLAKQIQNSIKDFKKVNSVGAHSSGASADADDRTFSAKPLDCCMGNKTLPLQTSFVKPDLGIACSTAVVSEKRVDIDKAGEDWRFGREDAQTGRNFGCSRTVRKFRQSKESVAKSYLLNNFYDVRTSNKFQLSPRNSHLAEVFNNAHETDGKITCAVGSKTVAASDTLKQDVVSERLDAFCSRENNLVDLQNPHNSDGGRFSRSTLPVGSVHEGAARFRIREISLGDYWKSWIRLLEGPDHVKPAQTGSPTAKSKQDYALGEYPKNLFRPPSSNTSLDARLEGPDYVKPAQTGSPAAKSKQDYALGEYPKNLFRPPSSDASLDARQKFEDYCSFNPHKHVSDDSGNIDSPQDMLASSSENYYKFLDHRMSSSQIKMGWGQECYASGDQSSHLELKTSQKSQKHDLRGATGRVDSQPHNEDSVLNRRFWDDSSSHSRMHSTHPSKEFCNNERTGEGTSMHQVWIRRWHSSAKFSAMSGKAAGHAPYFSKRLSSGQLVKSCSASAQCPLISSQKATASFDHNLTESGRGSSRYTEASGTRLDSGSASTTPGSLFGSKNFAAFRIGYMRSCAEAMAIGGKSASKLPPTSLQNRGFCGLPCTNPKFVKCKVLPEDETLHSVDSDNLKALERHIDDS